MAKKTTYLKANHFTVEFQHPDWSEADRKLLSECVLKAFPSMTSSIMDVLFMIPSDGRAVELITQICQSGVPDVAVRPLAGQGGPSAGFELRYHKGKAVDSMYSFDYEDGDELVLRVSLDFWEMNVVLPSKTIEIAVIKPRRE